MISKIFRTFSFGLMVLGAVLIGFNGPAPAAENETAGTYTQLMHRARRKEIKIKDLLNLPPRNEKPEALRISSTAFLAHDRSLSAEVGSVRVESGDIKIAEPAFGSVEP